MARVSAGDPPRDRSLEKRPSSSAWVFGFKLHLQLILRQLGGFWTVNRQCRLGTINATLQHIHHPHIARAHRALSLAKVRLLLDLSGRPPRSIAAGGSKSSVMTSPSPGPFSSSPSTLDQLAPVS
jgi:hypothetical protein